MWRVVSAFVLLALVAAVAVAQIDPTTGVYSSTQPHSATGGTTVNWGATTHPTTMPNATWVITYCRYFPDWYGTSPQYSDGLSKTQFTGYGPVPYVSKAEAAAGYALHSSGQEGAYLGGGGTVAGTRCFLAPTVNIAASAYNLSTGLVAPNPNAGSAAVQIDWNGSVVNPCLAIEGDPQPSAKCFVTYKPGTYGVAFRYGRGDTLTIVQDWPSRPPFDFEAKLEMQLVYVEGPAVGDAAGIPSSQPTTHPADPWQVAKTVMTTTRPIYSHVDSEAPAMTFKMGAPLGGFTPPDATITFAAIDKTTFVPLKVANAILTAFTGAACAYWVLQEFKRS